ncbi:PAS domain-containing sensor histidine kinase [Roseiarcus fermentans]|nr:PAS domain-containing sensor histidine kinase [Roseiarcus fermentans]
MPSTVGRPRRPNGNETGTNIRSLSASRTALAVNALFHAIVSSTSDAIVWKSLDGVIRGWNRGAELILGYTRAEMIGQSIHRILPDDRLIEEAFIFERIRHGERVEPFDTVRLRKDQASVHVSMTVSPILDSHGHIAGVCTIARDITERVRIDEALIARERELYQLAEAMPQVVWSTEADGRNTYFNQRWVSYTGLSLEESYGDGWTKPFHPDDRQRAWDAWRNAVTCGGGYSLECRLRRADGVYRWWLVRGVPFLDASGVITKWYGTCTDIQDMKQAEIETKRTRQLLAESEAQFRGAFETAAHGMALVSIDGTFTKVNQSLCKMLGYTESEFLQTTCRSITHPDDLEADLAHVRALLHGETDHYDREKRYRVRSGGVVWVLVSVSLIRACDGAPSHFVAQIQDISDRRAAEAVLCGKMTTSSRLSALGEMAGGIAHEINNPLAVIHALASDLAEQGFSAPGEAARCGGEIAQYADRIATIVRSLRHIARDGETDPFDEASISAIVQQTLVLCRARFRDEAVKLDVPPIDPELRILCREVQFSQILVNLLQNGFDAAQAQTGDKWVRLEVVTNDDQVTLSVIDSGKGIPEALKKRIMEPFFTTKPVGKGVGLGLSVSKKIAEDHGGTLEARESGGNTCFSLCLPLVRHRSAGCA